MVFSSVIAILLGGATAHAGACCVGSTSTVPTRVGECEQGTIGVAVAVETMTGSWNRDGELQSTGHSRSTMHLMSGAGYRFNRDLQVTTTIPFLLNAFEGTNRVHYGGGAGDVSAAIIWDPIEERPGPQGWPVPILTTGITFPTGRDWTNADGTLGEDVTGLESGSIDVGVSLERTMSRWPWALVGNGTLGKRHRFVALSGAAGHYFGTAWSVLGTAQIDRSWFAGNSASFTANSTVGVRAVHGRPLGWRAYIGADSSVDLKGAGRSAERTKSVSFGWVSVW